MSYSIDLKKISLNEYYDILKASDLLPSRMMLKENMEENFLQLSKAGFGDLDALFDSMNTPKKILELSERSEIPFEYLNILRREISSILTKTLPLKDIVNCDEIIEKLVSAGVKNSKDLWEADIDSLKHASGLSECEIKCCQATADLIRINGIRLVAAYLFYDAGYTSMKSIAEANAEEFLNKVNILNKDGRYYMGKLGLNDINYCIDKAKLILRYS